MNPMPLRQKIRLGKETRNQALHRPDALPGRKAIKRSIDNGLRVFLTAYSTNQAAGIAALAKLTTKDNGRAGVRK